LLILLHPMAPHCTAEAWELLHNPDYVAATSAVPAADVPKHLLPKLNWPKHNEKDLIDERVAITVMIQGKRRGQVELDLAESTDESKVMQLVNESSVGQKFLQGKKVSKVHFVPDRRIINIVL